MAPPMVANPVQNHPPSDTSDLLPIPKGSRCEITPQVRSIAHRTQTRMFKRTRLFFNQATFQVPNTVEEAFENMRLGTTDLDRNTSESTEGVTDLYLMSWSNTQFFSAQMAALGFRFISCNLRRNAGLEKPPPVEQWLRLERFSTPLPRRSVSIGPPAMSSQSAAQLESSSVPRQPLPSPPKSTDNSTNTLPKPAQQSSTPPISQSQKRSAPPDPASDQESSPARKLLRATNGIRLPSHPPLNPNADKPLLTAQARNKTSTHTTVPIIDLT